MFSVLFSLTRLLRNSILCSAVTNRVSHARLFRVYRELFLRPPLVTQTNMLFLDRHLCLRPKFLPPTEQSVVFRLSPVVSSASARTLHRTVMLLDCNLFFQPRLVPHTEPLVFFRLSPISSASAFTSRRTKQQQHVKCLLVVLSDTNRTCLLPIYYGKNPSCKT